MNCPKCKGPISKKDPFCQNCGKRLKHPFRALLITSLVFIIAMGIALTAFWFKGDAPDTEKQAAKEEPVAIKKKEDKPATTAKVEDKQNAQEDTTSSSDQSEYIQGEDALDDQPKMEKQTMKLEQKEDLTDYINSAKAAVFTVTTPEMQGSGFLYNANGAIVTNAHVIEGWTEATVHSSTGKTYTGKVIGYSNKTDVAVISVPELAGQQPFPLDTSSSINIGDEIVTLGSPLGKENTATMGYLTGMNREFIIGTFTYDHLFQISAPTAPGSSGGPLISKQSKKIIAINSAQSTSNMSVGFSIPLSQVSGLISGWISNPMDEKQLLAQFYGDDGQYVLGNEWDEEEGHFKDGDVSDNKDHYDYWEYGYEDYWKDKGGKAPAQQPNQTQDKPADKPTKENQPADKKSDTKDNDSNQTPADSTEQQEKQKPSNKGTEQRKEPTQADDTQDQQQDIAS